MNNDQKEYNNQPQEVDSQENQNNLSQQPNLHQNPYQNPNRKNYTRYSGLNDLHPCTRIGLAIKIVLSIINIIVFVLLGILYAWTIFLPIIAIIVLILNIIGLIWAAKIAKGKTKLGVGFMIYCFFFGGSFFDWILILIGWSFDSKNQVKQV